MKSFLSFVFFLVLVSCATLDVEKKVKAASGAGKEEPPRIVAVPIDAAPDPRIVEKPVYVPPGGSAPAPVRGARAVEQAAKQGTAQPEDYSAAAMLYDYHRDFVYEVYCRPLRLTDITLRPGERMVEAPFVSDSERWMLGAGVSYEGSASVQHIYVKPTAANLTATLILNTNERVYHITLKSFSSVHMPMVRWRYIESSLPQRYAGAEGPGVFTEPEKSGFSADPRFLSFDYKISWSPFRKPRWLPDLAYDDGKKTYITFPASVLQTELPAVFENRADVLNYRVAADVMIIDKLVETITVKIGDRSVTVEKKRGKK